MIDSSNPFEDEDEEDLSVYVCRVANTWRVERTERWRGAAL
jgi:hypothetical protein